MTKSLKKLEELQEKLSLTYKNIARNCKLETDFDENFINDYFKWNQDIVSFRGIEKNSNNPLFKNSSQLLTSATLQGFSSIKAFLPNSNNFSDLSGVIYSVRPSIDMGCCYVLGHDFIFHQDFKININNLNKTEINCEKIFDNFEKIRVIAVANNSFLGISKNIIQKIENDIANADDSNIELILLKAIFADRILTKTREFISNLQPKINPQIIQKIINLKGLIENQAKFATKIHEIIKDLILENQAQANNSNDSKEDNNKEIGNKNESEDFQVESVESPFNQENQGRDEVEEISKPTLEPKRDEMKLENSVDCDNYSNTNPVNILDKSAIDDDKIEFKNLYKIYTNKFDEVIYPKNFIPKKELELLRHQLDLKISKLELISKKISAKLKRKLLSKKNNYLEFSNSAGILNRKKLVNLILSPNIEDIWMQHKSLEYHDTILTILLDNSGSMRGNPIVMSAMACEIIANILEKFSIKTEIIGFTTSDWKGGKVKKLWEASGRVKNPGRLNELRHIIYKSFSQTFKKSKVNLGLMLKEGMLKENIDGEALLFARSRLMQQDAKRKILMVISDGTPVDDATNSNNEGDILADHLRHMINIIEKQAKIEIIGVGIGHATDDFYKNSIAVKSLDELGDVMIDKIINVL